MERKKVEEMNKKPGIFKRIARFIDKKIIVPVTKTIMKVTKKFGGSNRSLESWLSRSNTLLFVSFFGDYDIYFI